MSRKKRQTPHKKDLPYWKMISYDFLVVDIKRVIAVGGNQESPGPLDLGRKNDSTRQMTMPNRQIKKEFLNPDSG